MVDKPLGAEVSFNMEEDEQENDGGNAFLRVPKGDLYYGYKPDNSPEKFDFLQAKYVFRFPFTITAIKWGVALGSFFALHSYIKKRSISNSLYWFASGSFLTGMPIWGFFMLKYSFYSTSIKKFERDQIEQSQESFLAKDYFTKTLKLKEDTPDEKIMEAVNQVKEVIYDKFSELDDIEEDPEIFADLIKEEEMKKKEESKKKEAEKQENKKEQSASKKEPEISKKANLGQI